MSKKEVDVEVGLAKSDSDSEYLDIIPGLRSRRAKLPTRKEGNAEGAVYHSYSEYLDLFPGLGAKLPTQKEAVNDSKGELNKLEGKNLVPSEDEATARPPLKKNPTYLSDEFIARYGDGPPKYR
jgi:hypothetical protein